MAVNGVSSRPQMIPKSTERPWALLIGVLIMSTLRKLSHTTRPSRTATMMVAKLSSARIIWEASRATSVPSLPMATPMSAALRAGASLTPSPVMPHTSPWDWRALTMRILFCGEARAKTLYFWTATLISSSLMASSSGPVTALLCCSSTSPRLAPMARAVSLWSPVIMATRTPAPWASETASMHSGRGGSMMAQSPMMVNHGPPRPFTNSGPSCSPFLTSPFGRVPRRRASTRRPCELKMAICSVQYCVSIGSVSPRSPALACLSHNRTMRSGAPFTWTTSTSSIPGPSLISLESWTVAMNLYSELNGTSAMTGTSSFIGLTSMPAQ
mmetsp:Transcript_20653/g.58796  ORF Transcript_20653/g.58796 Transcript_20653/m.58796 type:complete len:327 (-) Transcript_20653:2163-3143(-)